MKREIKFRAWDKLSSQMLYSDYTHNAGLEVFFKAVRLNNGKDLSDVMQYTGLKDKNGKEIYEGDIVYMEFEASDNETVIANETNVVIYEEAIASFVFAPSTKHKGLTIRDFWKRYKDCKNVCFREIIGNIYENKELLN